MTNTQDYIKKISSFQKEKSEELKRPISLSEAIALWFTQSIDKPKSKKKKRTQVPLEKLVY